MNSESSPRRASGYTITTNQPTMTPNTESAPDSIGKRSGASAPDLKPGLVLAEPEALWVRPTINEPVVERDRRTEQDARGNVLLDEVLETPNVALGMSDAGTAEMGAGAWPP
jgi:hypothetical protein